MSILIFNISSIFIISSKGFAVPAMQVSIKQQNNKVLQMFSLFVKYAKFAKTKL